MACKRSGVRSPLAPPLLTFLLICFKLKHFKYIINPNCYTSLIHIWDLSLLKPIKIVPEQIKSRNNKWYMRASVPKELRKFFRNDRYVRWACSTYSERPVETWEDAKAIIDGAGGKALRDHIQAKMNASDPLVYSAEKLLESLFATYDHNGRINDEKDWHPSKLKKADCRYLATPKENPETYANTVARLRAFMVNFLDADFYDPTPIIDEAFKPVRRELDRGRGLGSKPLKKNQSPVTESIRARIAEVMNFHQDQLEDKLREKGTPHWYEWSKVGWVEDQVRSMRNSDTMKQKMSGGQMDDVEKMIYVSANIAQEDRDRYIEITKAFNEFNREEILKSSGKGKDAKGITFKDVCDGYNNDPRRKRFRTKDLKTQRGSQKVFMNVFGNPDIADIDESKGKQFINYLEKDYLNKQKRMLANATIRKKVGHIRQVLDWATEQSEYDYTNSWKTLSFKDRGLPEKKRKSWDTEIAKGFFKLDIDDGLKLMLRIMFCTGCRLEEACALKMGDFVHYGVNCISTERPSLEVKRTRGGDTRAARRKIPIIDILQKYIDEYKATFTKEERNNRDTFLFVDRFNFYRRSQDGKYSNQASDDLGKAIEPVRKKYKSDEYLLDLHSFRQTFSAVTSNAQINTETRQKIIGHRLDGMDAHYTYEPLSREAMITVKAELDKMDFNFIKGE